MKQSAIGDLDCKKSADQLTWNDRQIFRSPHILIHFQNVHLARHRVRPNRRIVWAHTFLQKVSTDSDATNYFSTKMFHSIPSLAKIVPGILMVPSLLEKQLAGTYRRPSKGPRQYGIIIYKVNATMGSKLTRIFLQISERIHSPHTKFVRILKKKKPDALETASVLRRSLTRSQKNSSPVEKARVIESSVTNRRCASLTLVQGTTSQYSVCTSP